MCVDVAKNHYKLILSPWPLRSPRSDWETLLNVKMMAHLQCRKIVMSL